MYKIILFLVTAACVYSVQAETWTLPPADIDVFGQIQTTTSSRKETLLDVAREYDIGQIEILLANPNIDRWLPDDGAEVILPSRYIIPQAERQGLVLNLPEMRLYFFPQPKKGEKPVVVTHPVSIGRMDWETPLGKTKIVDKRKDPTWTPPQSLKNKPLQQVVPHYRMWCLQVQTIHWVNMHYGWVQVVVAILFMARTSRMALVCV